MDRWGFVRIAVGAPRVHVGDPRANAQEILHLAEKAAAQSADLLASPELSLTGYTCGDLFGSDTLLQSAERELGRLASASASLFSGVLIVGLPLSAQGRLYNAAAVICQGRVLGCVPKSYLPNYREFYEQRHFTPASVLPPPPLVRFGFEPDRDVPFGADLLFQDESRPEYCIGVEICEDLWVPEPPGARLAVGGATVLVNPSASNELVGKADYRRMLVTSQSGRCIAAYAYAGAAATESTTDLVFGGDTLIAENGALLASGPRFERAPTLTIADVDVERLLGDRRRTNSWCVGDAPPLRVVRFASSTAPRPTGLRRHVTAHPFVPSDSQTLRDRCEEVFHIQTAALAKRIEAAGVRNVQIGVSGGLDSTLALLVAVRTFDLLGLPRSQIHGLSMPGFGTSDRTRTNADELMRVLGVSSDCIDVRGLCLSTFRSMGHRPFGVDPSGLAVEQFQDLLRQLSPDDRSDLVFENVQARVRTLLLMSRGFVVGTGDLSELALGWCTYNADHMSMYGVNVGVPKTLVKFLVQWAADEVFEGPTRTVLHSIADTEISPELLPVGADGRIQSTQDSIGPYELHDFFLYHLVRWGHRPAKILFLAKHAKFHRAYAEDEIRRWLTVFLKRFFTNQFKRSCIPDGPKVGTVSLSPRGDWRMPSDGEVAEWLADLEGEGAG